MTLSLTFACLWAFIACIAAMFPSKDHHWRLAYGLIALALPILIFVAYQHGLWIALLCLAGAVSVLRWPSIYLIRWVKSRL